MMKKIIISSLIISLLFGASACFTFAQSGSSVVMVLGTVQRVPVQELEKIEISNPNIVDILDVNSKEIILEAKSIGATRLSYQDKSGMHIVTLRVFNKDLMELKSRVDSILKNSGLNNIVSNINEDEGKIFLTGYVLNAQERSSLDKILDLVRGDVVDLVRVKEEEIAIEINVEVAELQKNDIDKLGVDWQLTPLLSLSEAPFAGPKSQLRWGYMARSGLSADINALVQKGKGKILSRPRIVCLSGKEAEILVGGEVPVVTINQSSEGTSTNVEYRQYGISLKIRPLVKADNRISVNLVTEISEIDGANSMIAGAVGNKNILIPAFTSERAETEMFLNDGDTALLAGLIKNKTTLTSKRFFLLGSIPYVGNLFKYDDSEDRQTELLITLTPRIVRPSQAPIAKQEQEERQTAQKQQIASISQQKAEVADSNLIRYNELINYEDKLRALSDYSQQIKDILTESVVYPSGEKLEKTVDVLLTLKIASDGKLKKLIMKKSSGNKAVDRLVMNTLKKKQIYPPFPSALAEEKEVVIDIPIIFQDAS